MPAKAVYLVVFEGFADWEPAHAVAELRRHGKYRVETIALTREPVQSMGGLTVLPSKALAEVDLDDVAVLILPGGDRWEKGPVEPELRDFVIRLHSREVPVAAICGATAAVAGMGLLHGRRHTSNGPDYLPTHVPGYAESANYVDEPAVRDRGLITASGLGDVEFARELFEELGVLPPEMRAAWARIFRSARLPQGTPS